MAIRYFKGIVSQKMKLFREILLLKLLIAVQIVFKIIPSIKKYTESYILKMHQFYTIHQIHAFLVQLIRIP